MLRAITATALRDIEPDDALPLTLQAGDRVLLSQVHPDRPDYRWGSDGGLCSGWVPLAVLSVSGTLGIATTEYCSQELPVKRGDVLRIMWKGQGFAACWCESRDGERGWVPNDALDIPPSQGVEL